MRTFAITEYRSPLQCVEVDVPQPIGTEVLLKVRAAGVCHTDLHIWDGGYDMGGGKTLKMADRGQALPHTMGHETVGEIVSAGPQAEGAHIGQTRLIYPWIGCGACVACKADAEHLCVSPQYLGVLRPGGFADYILVKHPRYLIDIGVLTPDEAAPYACSGLTAYSALKKLGKLINEPILIIGAGGLGLMCLSLLKALGGTGAVVVDPDPVKRQAAIEAGALAVIDPAANDVSSQIAKISASFWSIIDFVGSPMTWDLAMSSLNKGGIYVVVGLFGGEGKLSLPTLPLRSIMILGSFVGSRAELIELMALVGRGNVPRLPISKRSLLEANQTLMDLKNGLVVGRAVLVP